MDPRRGFFHDFEDCFEEQMPSESFQRYERCRSRFTGQDFSVKKYPTLAPPTMASRAWRDSFWYRESHALQLSTALQMPRVPVLLAKDYLSHNKERCIITELIQGKSLAKWVESNAEAACEEREPAAKKLTVEVLESVHGLHQNVQLVHLNISTHSLAVRVDRTQPFDQIRLLDFGFSRSLDRVGLKHLTINYAARNVKPTDVSGTFGAPEHVRSVYLQRQGQQDNRHVLINGPATDMWSTGIVSYVMLTGHHPFGNVDRFPHVSSQRLGFPCRRDTLQDEYLLSVAQQHTDWEAALAEGRDHPLLERVRQCSATPDLAVDFFKRILHPCPMCRLGDNALFHRYLKATTLQMQKQLTRPDCIPFQAKHRDLLEQWFTPQRWFHRCLKCSQLCPPQQQQQPQEEPFKDFQDEQQHQCSSALSGKPAQSWWCWALRKAPSAAKAAANFCLKFANYIVG